MRIRLKNFLCYIDRTFDFGTEGMTLVSGPSGSGKTSILRGIFFALFGEGSKLQSYGKKSTEVELDFDNLKIIRTKRPNRLVVNGIYEDEAGQEVINKKFSTTFKISGYIQQNNLTSFILKSPREKLEMLEQFSSGDIGLGDIKKRLKIELSRRKENLTRTESQLHVVLNILEETSEPEKVLFPVKCKPHNRSRVIRNFEIKYKNSSILISRVKKKLSKLEIELVALKVLNAKLESHTTQLHAIEVKMTNKRDELSNIDYKGSTKLTYYQELLEIVVSRSKIYDIRGRYEQGILELQEMANSENENRCKEVEKLRSTYYKDYSKEELSEAIKDIKINIEDFSKIKKLEEELDKISYNPEILSETKEKLDLLQKDLEILQKDLEILQLSQDSFTCPSCNSVLRLCDGELKMCKSQYKNDPEKLIDLEKQIRTTKKIIKKNTKELLNIEHNNKRYEKYKQEYEEIITNYDEYNVSDSLLSNLHQDLEYLLDYRSSQKVIGKKIEELSNNTKLSETYYIFNRKIELLGIELRSLEDLSKLGKSLEIEDKELLYKLIEEEKESQRNFTTLSECVESLELSFRNTEDLINSLKSAHQNTFSNFHSEEEVEKYKNKYNIELLKFQDDRKKYLNTLEKIKSWEIYEKERKEYEKLEERVKDLKIQQTTCRKEYGAIMTLKEKILEAESIAMLQIIDTINTHARTFLDIFFPDNPISVQLNPFKTTKKSVKPSITVQIEYKGMECDLLMLSGGELSRVVLAYTLALGEIFNTPLLLLDECTASLDQEMTGIVFEGIKDNFNGKLSIIIAHQVISGTFDKIVKL